MVRIAVAQTPGAPLQQWPETLELIAGLVRRAAGGGADIVLFPEGVWPAYDIGSKQALFDAQAAGMPDERFFLDRLAIWAREHRIAICAGYLGRENDKLYNAACLIDATGKLRGTYAKCFLWDFDRRYFEPGERIEPVDTDLGRIGMMICADARLPEMPATLVSRGATLILQPTAWVNVGRPGAHWNPQPDHLIPARAAEFGVPIASASKWGVERETTFVGSSLICDATGNVPARCGTSETTVIVADVELTTPQRAAVTDTQRSNLLADTTPDPPAATVRPLSVIALSPAAHPDDIRRCAVCAQSDPTVPRPCLFLRPSRADKSASPPFAAGEGWLALDAPSDDLLALHDIRLCSVAACDARRFAAIRSHALRGIHVAVVFGDEARVATLRTRAAENRIFLVWVSSSGVVSYDPGGRQIARLAWPDDLAGETTTQTLDVAQAAEKQVAPNTDPFVDRRPKQYAF